MKLLFLQRRHKSLQIGSTRSELITIKKETKYKQVYKLVKVRRRRPGDGMGT
jgi:hypothetical protein